MSKKTILIIGAGTSSVTVTQIKNLISNSSYPVDIRVNDLIPTNKVCIMNEETDRLEAVERLIHSGTRRSASITDIDLGSTVAVDYEACGLNEIKDWMEVVITSTEPPESFPDFKDKVNSKNKFRNGLKLKPWERQGF